jgi:hypothetical protein
MAEHNNDLKSLLQGLIDSTGKLIKYGSVSKEIADARFEICRSCEHFSHSSGRCGLCGCFMRPKVRIAAASCPDEPKRWQSEITEEALLPSDNQRFSDSDYANVFAHLLQTIIFINNRDPLTNMLLVPQDQEDVIRSLIGSYQLNPNTRPIKPIQANDSNSPI